MHNKQRIYSFDFIRALCAVGIIVFHFSCELDNSVSTKVLHFYSNGSWGNTIVNIFFLLSGAMLYYNNSIIKSLKVFYYKRFKSIFPMFYKKYLDNHDEICFVIEECSVLNRIVGSLSLYSFRGDTVEFGKILIGDKEAHGKQIGYNATVAALRIAFEVLNLKTVVLEVYEENIAAKKIYEKAGFVYKCDLRDDDIGKVLFYEINGMK